MMALHNINTLHWHPTDDQGWRIEIKSRPLLTELGSKRDGTVIGHNSGKYDGIPVEGFYTQEEAREIVKYAADRHITVIPEIDLFGHMLGALKAYPELGCTGGSYEVWSSGALAMMFSVRATTPPISFLTMCSQRSSTSSPRNISM